MDELKLLIDMVAGLPTLAVWVLVGYLAYKVAVVGSVYGVIRLMIIKWHDWKVAPRVTVFKIGSRMIDESVAEALNAQLTRIITGEYCHMSDVQKLRAAIDAMGIRAAQEKQK